MTPDSHIKQHNKMFREAEECLECFRILMNKYSRKNNLTSLENAHLYILCILSNMCALIKNYCLCDQRWEEIFISGNIYVLINESIKKIIGFQNKNGNRKRTILEIVDDEIPENLRTIFDNLKKEFIDYADRKNLQDFIKNERNSTIHFDEDLDAIRLFKFQVRRNPQVAFDHLTLWFILMHRLNDLIIKCMSQS